jgi:hypothetical protein
VLFELDTQLEFQRHRVLVGEALCVYLHWQGIISVVNRGEQELGSTKYVVTTTTTTTTHSPMCEEGKFVPRIRLSRKPIFQFSGCIIARPESDYPEKPIFKFGGFAVSPQKQAPQM